MKLKKSPAIHSLTPVACLMAVAVAPLTPRTKAAVVSDPVTASKVTINSGATFVAPVGRKAPSYRGRVAGVAGNTLTLAGSPGWAANQFAPVAAYSGGPEFFQYLVILRSDRSADGPGNQGDWWLVDSNTANTLTVEPSAVVFGSTASRLAAGDIVEIIRLNSIKDVFGAGPTLRITADDDFDDTTGDYLRFVAGTSFGSSLIYHDGSVTPPAGWYLDFTHVGDGSLITLYPDQAVMAFRQGAATDLHSAGTLHSYALTHYVATGANPQATGFGKAAPLASSGLLAAGFLDTDFDDTTEDFIRFAIGTSFGSSIIYHNGSSASPGWYLDFTLDNTVALPTAVGFFLFADGPITWRQTPPFVP